MRPATFLLFLVAVTPPALSQSELGGGSTMPPAYNRQTLTISFGAGIPQSRDGLTEFWNMGPNGSARFMVQVSKPVAMGIGVHLALLKFNESLFRLAHPAIPVRSKDIVLSNVYLAMKCTLTPSMRLSPYLGMAIGTTHVSEAVYREVVDSVQVRYYNILARTQLTVGVMVGVDVYIARWIAFELEAETSYVHHSVDLGLASYARGGFRFTL